MPNEKEEAAAIAVSKLDSLAKQARNLGLLNRDVPREIQQIALTLTAQLDKAVSDAAEVSAVEANV